MGEPLHGNRAARAMATALLRSGRAKGSAVAGGSHDGGRAHFSGSVIQNFRSGRGLPVTGLISSPNSTQ
ncbi:MAG: hypothetical protein ABSC94_18570, partial [Polyangiaceae bacterium]